MALRRRSSKCSGVTAFHAPRLLATKITNRYIILIIDYINFSYVFNTTIFYRYIFTNVIIILYCCYIFYYCYIFNTIHTLNRSKEGNARLARGRLGLGRDGRHFRRNMTIFGQHIHNIHTIYRLGSFRDTRSTRGHFDLGRNWGAQWAGKTRRPPGGQRWPEEDHPPKRVHPGGTASQITGSATLSALHVMFSQRLCAPLSCKSGKTEPYRDARPE